MTLATTESTRIAQIRQAYKELETSVRTSVEKALEIGRLLCEQKKEMEHGQFMPWLRQNIPFITQRTCNRWMELHRHRAELRLDTVSNLKEAYRLLKAPGESAVGKVESNSDGVFKRAQELAEKRLHLEVDIGRALNELDRLLVPPRYHERLGLAGEDTLFRIASGGRKLTVYDFSGDKTTERSHRLDWDHWKTLDKQVGVNNIRSFWDQEYHTAEELKPFDTFVQNLPVEDLVPLASWDWWSKAWNEHGPKRETSVTSLYDELMVACNLLRSTWAQLYGHCGEAA